METPLGTTIKLTYMGLDEFPERSEPAMWVEYGGRPHDHGTVPRFWTGDPAIENDYSVKCPIIVVTPDVEIVIKKICETHRVVHVYAKSDDGNSKLITLLDIPKGTGMVFLPER